MCGLVVLTREGGLILAVPVDFFTEAELEKGNQDGEDGMLGASEILLVNAVHHHSGEPVADGLPVLVADMDVAVLENLTQKRRMGQLCISRRTPLQSLRHQNWWQRGFLG